jgi:hypothetical protein
MAAPSVFYVNVWFYCSVVTCLIANVVVLYNVSKNISHHNKYNEEYSLYVMIRKVEFCWLKNKHEMLTETRTFGEIENIWLKFVVGVFRLKDPLNLISLPVSDMQTIFYRKINSNSLEFSQKLLVLSKISMSWSIHAELSVLSGTRNGCDLNMYRCVCYFISSSKPYDWTAIVYSDENTNVLVCHRHTRDSWTYWLILSENVFKSVTVRISW